MNTSTDIIAAFLPAGLDACALYRMYQPHLNVKYSKFLFRMGALDVRELGGAQVCVVQRLHSEDNIRCIYRMRELGMRVIYDLDDNIWALTSSNPHQVYFKALKDDFHKCAAAADALTVSTRGLQSAVKMGFQLPHEIFIVPNAIDMELFQPKNVVENNELTIIGWGGSNTHGADVKEAFSIVPDILDKFPNLRMEIVGAPAIDRIREHDKYGRIISERYEASPIAKHKQTNFRTWVPVAEYPNRLASWNWDIFLAPLEDSRFNRSKSAIKMLEAAALRKPCLASDVQPYREFAALGGDDLLWLLCNSPREWNEKLIELVTNRELRLTLGQKMYDVMYQYFNMEKVADIWKYVFKKVTGNA